MADFKFEIVKSFGVLSTNKSNWTKELNLVSWDDREPKLDIRDWSPNHEKMGKGVSLNNEEARNLFKVLENALPENA